MLIDEGLRVAKPQTLLDKMIMLGIEPSVIYADRFLMETLQDILPSGWQLLERKTTMERSNGGYHRI